jgi:hypothetical protein
VAKDARFPVNYPIHVSFGWLAGLWICYISEKYGESWLSVIGAVIREYVIKDKRNLDFDDLKRFILDHDEYRSHSGEVLFQVIDSIDKLKLKRKNPSAQIVPTISTYAGRRRRIEVPVGQIRLMLGMLEHGILSYYSAVSGYAPNQVLRLLLRGYMVADSRLAVNEFRTYIDNAKQTLPNVDEEELEKSWATFLDSRDRTRKARKVRKALKKSEG